MHSSSILIIILILIGILMVCQDVQAADVQLVDTTRTSFLTGMPWFRGLMRVFRPNPQAGRKSDYRSELDANYVNYRGSQLWKIALGLPRKRRELLDGEPLRGFIEKYDFRLTNSGMEVNSLLAYKQLL